jgi:hypothetical protein
LWDCGFRWEGDIKKDVRKMAVAISTQFLQCLKTGHSNAVKIIIIYYFIQYLHFENVSMDEKTTINGC